MRDGGPWPPPAQSSPAQVPTLCPTLAPSAPLLLAHEEACGQLLGLGPPQARPLGTRARTPSAHLKSEGRVTLESGSRRKCF